MLVELLKEFSIIYESEVKERFSSNLRSYKILVNEIPLQLSRIVEKYNLKIKGSIGVGNSTYYPWVAFFDDRVSTGATNGFYVVLLFSDDFNDLYLTLNQGSTRQSESVIEGTKDFIYKCFTDIPRFVKGTLPPRSLVKTKPYNNSSNGKKYEDTNMFYKKYVISELDEVQLKQDIIDIIEVYQECALKYSNEFENSDQSTTDDNHKIYKGKDNMFNFLDFEIDLDKCNLKFQINIILRFISSLASKPFIILTGLSGSGKTKLAQAFASWICDKDFQIKQNIINTTVKYTEKSIENSFGWTLKKDVIEQLIGEDDKYVKSNIAGIDLERCKLEYKNIFYYKTDEQKENLSKKIKEEYSIGDEIPVKIFIEEDHNQSVSGQYKLIPVGADWTNREPLLGYPNALETGKYVKPENGVLDLLLNAKEHPDKPYFLILDEMNLSHVERYFADFLSAMESEEAIPLHPDTIEWKNEDGNWNDGIPDKIKLPPNLFIIGTVNIDETTYMFSPKVLDRANVIEFRVTDKELKKFLKNPLKPDLDLIKGKGAEMAEDFVNLAKTKPADFDESKSLNKTLLEFFDELKKTGAEFGYRTTSEIHSFCSKLNILSKNEELTITIDEMIDAAVLQKLLPKLHGSRKKLEPVLNSLAILCLIDLPKDKLLKLKKGKNPNIGAELDKIVYDEKYDINYDEIRFNLSMEKILRMKKRLIQEGFTSFAEA